MNECYVNGRFGGFVWFKEKERDLTVLPGKLGEAVRFERREIQDGDPLLQSPGLLMSRLYV